MSMGGTETGMCRKEGRDRQEGQKEERRSVETLTKVYTVHAVTLPARV